MGKSAKIILIIPKFLLSEGSRQLKHRARYAIVTDILDTCRKPALQTHIMYKANLSYDSMKSYLKMLMDSGLLRSEEDKESNRMFVTTRKGLELLEHSYAIKNLMGESK
jgi:predicted transcriptional regulator